jgi:hypothetical protein
MTTLLPASIITQIQKASNICTEFSLQYSS